MVVEIHRRVVVRCVDDHHGHDHDNVDENDDDDNNDGGDGDKYFGHFTLNKAEG